MSNERLLGTVAILLIVFWVLGLATSATAGGLLHILLVVAVVVILIRIIQGRRVLSRPWNVPVPRGAGRSGDTWISR